MQKDVTLCKSYFNIRKTVHLKSTTLHRIDNGDYTSNNNFLWVTRLHVPSLAEFETYYLSTIEVLAFAVEDR